MSWVNWSAMSVLEPSSDDPAMVAEEPAMAAQDC
jgi:hypothetical protein